MHELSLMCAVLDAIMEQAVGNAFSRVHRVSVAVGALCNIEDQALAFCFDIVMQGTMADGAVLDIVSVPGTGWCPRCRHNFPVVSLVAPCPSCGTWEVDMSGGDQITVTALEVE
jgi:hydrogenase nickel incorporation protein HypA/HybF